MKKEEVASTPKIIAKTMLNNSTAANQVRDFQKPQIAQNVRESDDQTIRPSDHQIIRQVDSSGNPSFPKEEINKVNVFSDIHGLTHGNDSLQTEPLFSQDRRINKRCSCRKSKCF